MGTSKGAVVRKEFYARATHVLFAIVLAHSFLLASEVLVPISVVLESDDHTAVATLAFSYVLIISGWIGYSRSVSYRPYKDTVLGAMRFVLDIVILFEYFYLIRISVEHASHFPFVVVVIALTYLLSDIVKYYEQAPQVRPQIRMRTRRTVILLVLVADAAALSLLSAYNELAQFVGIGGHMLTIIIFAVLVVLYRAFQWKLAVRRKRRG